MKKYRSYSKKRISRRRRRTTKRSSKYARRQQTAASTWIRKKYTKVLECPAFGLSNVWQGTISLIGGKNSNNLGDTYTLDDVNQDNQLASDMRLYQFFRIRGVGIKLFFPQPTDVASSPVQWALAYSQNEVILPEVIPARAQTLATYQTGSCSQSRPISRFYNTAKTLRRFGIQYCDTIEWSNGLFGGANNLYNQQLGINQGSSVNIKVYRQENSVNQHTIARCQITYYVTYKGQKGASSLINP